MPAHHDIVVFRSFTELCSQLIETAEGMRYLHELDPPIVHADIRGVSVQVYPAFG
jgi:hypothetical protein